MRQVGKGSIVLAIFCQLDTNLVISGKRGIPVDKLSLPDWPVGRYMRAFF